MTDRLRRLLGPRLVVAVLLAALAGALFVPAQGWLRLAGDDRTRVSELRAVLAGVPDTPIVVVGFDPDLGTYPEIRATVRVLVGDLLDRGARLALVSFTAEGRALAVEEIARLRAAGVGDGRLLDLGFRPGAEAAMVRSVRGLLPAEAEGDLAAAIAEAGGGMDAAAMALVVGGNDLGPRTWAEQVWPRIPALPLVAVAPTALLPELQPLLATGQLDALLGTLRDAATYRETVSAAPLSGTSDAGREPLSLLVGIVAALAVLVQGGWSRTVGALRGATVRGQR